MATWTDRLTGVTLTLDEQGPSAELVKTYLKSDAALRSLAVVKQGLGKWIPARPRVLPDRLTGTVLQPDGTPADGLLVGAPRPPGHHEPWPAPIARTDVHGRFDLDLPPGPLPDDGLAIVVRGAGRWQRLVVGTSRLSLGDAGPLVLPSPLAPLGIIGGLADIVEDWAPPGPLPEEPAPTDEVPPVALGEGDCARSFRTDPTVERFGCAVLFRLVAPELWPPLVVRLFANNRPLPTKAMIPFGGTLQLRARSAVAGPIDVRRFRDTLGEDPESLPMAGTLGLGYVLKCSQDWVPAGYSLGNLLYSLALAPGERQVIGVVDRHERLRAMDRESLSVTERFALDEARASTASELFTASLRDAMEVHADWWTEAESSGGSGGINLFGIVSFGGGGSSASASGGESSWQSLTRDFASSAVDTFHGQIHRRSSASRRSDRIAVRQVSLHDSERFTTKLVENHNRRHALTMQWWEVLRHFTVTTRPDDVQLVALVPLLPVQWLPDDQPRTLPDYPSSGPPGPEWERDALLARWSTLLARADDIERVLRRPALRQGLRALRRFHGDPRMELDVPASTAPTITVRVNGSFLPHDVVTATFLTTGGRRVGPVTLPRGEDEPTFPDAFDREALIGSLRDARGAAELTERVASVQLPAGVRQSELTRMELRYQATAVTHTPPDLLSGSIEDLLAMNLPDLTPFTLTSADLITEVGGPVIADVRARLGAIQLVDAYAQPEQRVLLGTVPFPVDQPDPGLAVSELAAIEALLQHVLAEPIRFDRAVWLSLTPEERAILLDRYTIGPPGGGTGDEVPLLDCVDNRVLGLHGNCLVMPFRIPQTLADEIGFTSLDVQEGLLRFHAETFRQRTSNVALRTHGMLGEAVLGGCDAAERIDLTRFWNWGDGEAEGKLAPASLAPLDVLRGAELIGTGQPTPGSPFIAPVGPDAAVTAPAPKDLLATLLEKSKSILGTVVAPPTGDLLQQLVTQQIGVGADGKPLPGSVGSVEQALLAEAAKRVVSSTKVLRDLLTQDLKDETKKLTDETARMAAPAATPSKVDQAVTALVTAAPGIAAWLTQTPEAGRAAEADKIVKAYVPVPATLTLQQRLLVFGAFQDAAPTKNADGTTTPDPQAAGKKAMRDFILALPAPTP
jgi:hypothetical protein